MKRECSLKVAFFFFTRPVEYYLGYIKHPNTKKTNIFNSTIYSFFVKFQHLYIVTDNFKNSVNTQFPSILNARKMVILTKKYECSKFLKIRVKKLRKITPMFKKFYLKRYKNRLFRLKKCKNYTFASSINVRKFPIYEENE